MNDEYINDMFNTFIKLGITFNRMSELMEIGDKLKDLNPSEIILGLHQRKDLTEIEKIWIANKCGEWSAIKYLKRLQKDAKGFLGKFGMMEDWFK